MYAPLRVHGHHSMLTGVDAPRALLERARDLGLPALALTDVDNLAGVVDFLRAAEALRAATPELAVHGIVGAEISQPVAGRDEALPGRVIALVRNAAGWRNLCKLVSARQLGADPGDPEDELDAGDDPAECFDLAERAARYQEGLVYLVDHPDLLVRLAGRVDARWLFAAISPAAIGKGAVRRTGGPRNAHLSRNAGPPRRMASAGEDADDAPGDLSAAKVPPAARSAPARELLEAARAVGVAALAVPDAYWAHPVGADDHRVRTAIKHNALAVDLPDAWLAEEPAHLLSFREACALYAGLEDVSGSWPVTAASAPAADVPCAAAFAAALADPAVPPMVARTLAVAGACRFAPPLDGVLFPEVALAEGETPYSRLCQLAFEGAHTRYRPLRPEVVRRLDFELSVIDRLGFAPYFLLVREIADFARDAEIPFVGRGSAAASLVSYALGLTDADPLRYRLPFERFLNPARTDRPDIDLDFCWRRRDEVLEHVYELFGTERTAMICTIATCGLRSAFREVALAEGIPPAEIHRWSRSLPHSYGTIPFDGATATRKDLHGDVGADGHAAGSARPPRARAGALATGPCNMEAREGRHGEVEASGHAASGSMAERDLHEKWGSSSFASDSLRALPTAADACSSPSGLRTESGSVRDDSGEDLRGTSAHRPSSEEAGELPAHLPPHLASNPIARALATTPECREFPFDDMRWQRVLRAAERLVDAPRHFGLHPGGVVVSPGPITDFVPCQSAAKGCVVTQLDKDAVEAIGLVKMDLLGNRALTTIDDCVRGLRAAGIAVDPAAVPEDDPLTAAALREGRTLGCFQVESPGMRNLLKQTGARDMDDVIQAVALIRPGPAGAGMKDAYVRRFRGVEEPAPPHPRLTELLWETHGVMLYQEDVMQAVALLAGMDLAEADLLRRALGKRREKVLRELVERFLAGCQRTGVARADAERVWDLVSNFASFAFCKAHAVTYGRIAYRAVWLKAHYPAAFLAAFLASETGYYRARVYVEEARRLGVPILPPDVNQSGATFAVEWCRPAAGPAPRPSGDSREAIRRAGAVETSERPPAGCIRVGLGQVKGLSRRTLETILADRAARGPQLSLAGFLERTAAHTDEVEALIQCGAFDSFDRTRPELLWRLHLLRRGKGRAPRDLARELDPARLAACVETPESRARTAVRRANAATGGWSQSGLGLGRAALAPGETASLFPEPETPGVVLPGLPEWDARTRGLLELELLGLTIGAHPTALFDCAGERRATELGSRCATRGGPRPVNRASCAALERFVGGRVTLLGWLAASRRVRTSGGQTMRFLTLEDETGLAEIVLFPPVYQSDGHRLTDQGPYLITGVVEDQMGACTLHAERIW